MSPPNSRPLRIGLIAVSALLLAAATWLIGRPLIRFASEPEAFRAWVQSRGVWGVFCYMGMVIVQVLLAFIPGEPFELAAGYAFGALWGTVYAAVAAAVGSLLVFLLVRRFGLRLVTLFFPAEKLQKLRFLQTTPKRTLLLLIIFMLPGTPKDLLCYYAGLTDLPFGVWLVICLFGRLPSIVTSTVGGHALGSRNYLTAAVVFAVTLLISLAGLLIYDRICRQHGKNK